MRCALGGGGVDDGQVVNPVGGVGDDDAAVGQPGVAGLGEHPGGGADLAAQGGHRGDGGLGARHQPGRGVDAVEVPPVGPVGHEPQVLAVPLRLRDRLLTGPHQAARRAHPAPVVVVVDGAEPQLGAVPRHVGVIPLQPAQRPAVGAGPGRGHEVGAADQHGGLGGPGGEGLQGHDLIGHLGPAVGDPVALAHGDDPPAVGGDDAVGVPVAVGLGRLRGEGHRGLVGVGLGRRVDAVQPLVSPVGEEQRAAVDPPRSPAVLVHSRPGGEALGQHVDGPATGLVAHDHDAPGVFGAQLRPPQLFLAHAHVAEADGPGHHQLGGDGRRP